MCYLLEAFISMKCLREGTRSWCPWLPMGKSVGKEMHSADALWCIVRHGHCFPQETDFKRGGYGGHFPGLLGAVPLGKDSVCLSKARRLGS